MSELSYDLVSAADYENLPIDPEECFLALEDICQRSMNRMIDENSSSDFYAAVRMQYVTTVTAYAQECGIDEIVKAQPTQYDYNEFAKFSLAVKGATARIRFRNRAVLRSTSVLLAQNTRTKIDHYISRLREAIENSDLSSERKAVLCKKLEELRSELSQPRLGFIKTFTVLSLILAGLSSATTISADGPNAVTNIMRLIGTDRETEEAAAQRLMPPPKALPAPPIARVKPPVREHAGWDARASSDVDDEIPF
jgi:hypothetical protein